MESRNELRNFLGGFTDLEDHFLTTVKVREFIPLISNTRKFVLAFHVKTPNGPELVQVAREHLGHFIGTRIHQHTPEKLMGIANAIIAQNGPIEDAAALAPEDATPEAIFNTLCELSKIVTSLEIVTAKPQERLEIFLKIVEKKLWTAHTAFMDLASCYVTKMTEVYPDEMHILRNLSELLVTKTLPMAYTRAVLLPLFIPSFHEKTVSVEINGESLEVSKYCLTFVPFNGFGYQGGTTCTPWNGKNDQMVQELDLALDTSTTDSAIGLVEMMKKLRGSAKGAVKNILDGWDNAVLMDPCNASISMHAKAVKKFFGTHLGLAMLQNQLQLITPSWGLMNMIDGDGSEEINLEKVLQLSAVRCKKFSWFLETFPQNAFNFDNTTVMPIERTGDASAVKMHKIFYVPGDQGYMIKLMRQLGFKFQGYMPRGGQCNKIMQYGLFSAYNSTESSVFGNLNNRSGDQQSSIKEMLDDINHKTYKKWVYELKTIPIGEPGNFMSWFYNARLALLTTVASTQGYTAALDGSGKKLDEMTSSITVEMCKESVRGFLARTKASSDTKGCTFDLSPGVLTSKAYAITKSDKAPPLRSSNDFKRLEWHKKSADDTERMRYLAENYNIKDMLLRLNGEFLFFYKRLLWQTPKGIPIKMGRVMKTKKSFTNAPTAFLGSHAIVDSIGRWVTSTVDSDLPWAKIEIYQVAIDNNMCFSEETRNGWSLTNTHHRDIFWADILTELLENADGGSVATSDINNFSINKTTFDTIVNHLKGQGKYTEDCPGEWLEEAEVEDETEEDQPRKRSNDDVMETLTQTLLKRQKLCE